MLIRSVNDRSDESKTEQEEKEIVVQKERKIPLNRILIPLL
jgi:hypothetical protein